MYAIHCRVVVERFWLIIDCVAAAVTRERGRSKSVTVAASWRYYTTTECVVGLDCQLLLLLPKRIDNWSFEINETRIELWWWFARSTDRRDEHDDELVLYMVTRYRRRLFVSSVQHDNTTLTLHAKPWCHHAFSCHHKVGIHSSTCPKPKGRLQWCSNLKKTTSTTL